ncbi:MAG: hypothetical protein WEB62_03395 [Bacteroidota bacterium]
MRIKIRHRKKGFNIEEHGCHLSDSEKKTDVHCRHPVAIQPPSTYFYPNGF